MRQGCTARNIFQEAVDNKVKDMAIDELYALENNLRARSEGQVLKLQRDVYRQVADLIAEKRKELQSEEG